MKRIITIQILLMFLNINAQINPVKDALNYYPLHIGDFWQYQFIYSKFEIFHEDTSIIHREVIGDTLMPNGKKYFIVHEFYPYPPKRYLRIDSTNTILYAFEGNIERGIDSLLLKQGVHPKIVQERLGHAGIAITLDLYSHVAPGLQQAAANRFDDIILSNTTP